MANQDDSKIELSRRKTLTALGTIGVASAGAGLGTSAYFSDTESFNNNKLTAGSLDLKVDWEEHYSDWSNDEMVQGMHMGPPASGEDPYHVLTLSGDQPGEQSIQITFLTEDALEAFMDATTVESFPDRDNNAIQDVFADEAACQVLGSTPDVLSSNLRTDGTFAGQTTAPGDPLIQIDDVKPGDFGEATLSFHLCDNPGYIWMNGELVSAGENSLSEPEADDPDEVENTVELLDQIQTRMWYDEDGDNVYEPSGATGDAADIVLVLDESGSMQGTKMTQMKDGAKTLIDTLDLSSNRVGVVSFQNSATIRQGLTGDASAAKSAVDGIANDSDGLTNMEDGVETGQSVLSGGSNPRQIMVFLGDGQPTAGTTTDGNQNPNEEATTAKNAGTEIFTIGYGVGAGSTADTILFNMASDPKNGHYFRADTDEIEAVFANIGTALAGEKLFFEGTLREALTELSGNSGRGIPLDGNRTTAYDELNDPEDGSGRDCFVNSTTNAVGFQWWLPVDHGNEVQTDSVEFDLGFYAEQCRHNDGSGMAAESAN